MYGKFRIGALEVPTSGLGDGTKCMLYVCSEHTIGSTYHRSKVYLFNESGGGGRTLSFSLIGSDERGSLRRFIKITTDIAAPPPHLGKT